MAEATNEAAQTVPVMSIEELRSRVDANNAFLLAVRRAVHGRQIYGAICYDPHKLKIATRLLLPLPKDGTPVGASTPLLRGRVALTKGRADTRGSVGDQHRYLHQQHGKNYLISRS